MNYAAILKGRTRALLMDFSSLAVIVIVIIACVFIAKSGNTVSTFEMPVAVINNDSGELGEELVNILLEEEEYTFYLTTEEEAVKAIARNKAQGMAVIREDFSEKIKAGDFTSLVDVTVMSDSPEFVNFTEFVMNDVTKVWMELFGETKLKELEGVSDEEIQSFHERTMEVWRGDSLIKVKSHMIGVASAQEEEEESFSGLRWYAALSLFYLMIGGIWMCDYGSGLLMGRALGRNCNIALLFLAQSLPGLCITTLGLIPVLIAENPKQNPVLMIAAYVVYVLGASGMALVFCSLAGKLSNLVLIAPVVSMAASMMSGLLCRLPDWAGFWETMSVIFPGRWFQRAVLGQSFFVGSVVSSVIWFAAGMLVAGLLAGRKKNRK